MTTSKTKNTLIIFLKYPQAGKVKTRLAKDIGDQRAAGIYSEMSKTIIDNVSVSNEYQTVIFFDPPEKENEIREWIGRDEALFFPQAGDTLGDRISNAFKEVFSSESEKVIIIGTDCIEVTHKTITRAIDSLKDVDVVLGPAEDGGYYLLGLNSFTPEIFQGIQWSTQRVLNQTLERIKEKNLNFELLETLKDIDTLEDFNSLFGEFDNTTEDKC